MHTAEGFKITDLAALHGVMENWNVATLGTGSGGRVVGAQQQVGA